MTTPDPIAEAAAYQRALLDALGEDDPAEAQSGTPAAARFLIAEAGLDVRTPPAPAEWSVLQCVAHIADAEIVMAGRYRFVLAQEEPELIGYDQDLWITALRHGEDDPERMLALFEALRTANLDLWRRTPATDRARIGRHRERGPESYDLMFRMIGGHDRIHMAQARTTLEAVRAQPR